MNYNHNKQNKQASSKSRFFDLSFLSFRIAWRNIWRNHLRSSVVLMAIAVGIFGGLASVGIMKGMILDLVDNALKTETSHIQIHNSQFAENNEVHFTIPNEAESLKKIRQLEEVAGACSRTKVFGMAATASKGSGVMVNGIDPESEKNVSKVYTLLTDSQSTWFESGKKNRIVISQKLAEKLKAKIKSKVIITFQDYDGNLTGASFKVEGIFKTQNSMFDEMNVFVQQKDLNRLLVLPEDQSHEIAIMLKDHHQTDQFTTQLKTMFPDLLTEPWHQINPYIKMSSDMISYMLFIFMSIILLALGFAIVNTMLMVVLERRKELGMIMSIGMNRPRVFSMIMWETVLLSLTGAAIGIVLSSAFVMYFGQNGIDVSSVSEGFESVGYTSIIFPELNIMDYVQVVILVFITGIIASIFPSIRALKMKPAEAVKE